MKEMRPANTREPAGPDAARAAALVEAIWSVSYDCLKRLDLDGNVLRVSDAGRRMLQLDDGGPSPSVRWAEWWGWPERAKVERAIATAREGQTATFEAWSAGRDGGPRCWQVTVSPILGPDGRAVELLATSRDVTETCAQAALAAVHRPANDPPAVPDDVRSAAHLRDYAIFALDGEGRVTAWNAGARALFGHEAAEIVGRPGDVLWTPEDRAAGVPAQEMATAAREGVARDRRWHLRADGSRVFVDGATLARTDADGRPTGFVKVGRDESRHRVVEEELALVRGRLDSALAAAEIGTFEWDLVTDRIRGDANFQRIFGVPIPPGETLPIEVLLDVLDPDDLPETMARIRATIERDERYETEYRIRHGDGSVRWVIARGKVARDAAGAATQFTGVLLDITDRKRAEAERQAIAEERAQQARIYETILSTTDDFAYIFDLQGRFLYANRRLLEVWGTTLEDAVGKSLVELGYPVWHAAMHLREIDEVIRTKRPVQGEIPFVGASGQGGVYDYVFSPVIGPDCEVERLVGTTRDVTARRRADDARRIAEARTRFLADLSEATRDLVDPSAVVAAVAQRLGEHLGVSRCAYADVAADGDAFVIFPDYCNVGVASCAGAYRLDAFGARAAALMRAGRTLVVRDVERELAGDDLDPDGAATFLAIDIRAIVCCPLIRGGRLVGMMAVHQQTPRDWTANDVSLVEATVERAWAYLERARGIRELAESEARFRQLADAMPQMVWAARPDGTVDYLNARWADYADADAASGGDAAWEAMLAPEDAARVRVAWARAVAAGAPYEIEVPLRRRDGQFRWHLGRALPVRDAEGRIVRWYGTNTDIHDQKLAEAALAESEARFRQLADAMPQIVFAATPEGHVDYFNRRWYEYTGLPRPDEQAVAGGALGEGHWSPVHTPEGLARAMEAWPHAVATGEPYEIEYALRRHDGQFRWHLGRALPVRDASGRIVRWYGTNTDIHDQKVAENALAAEKAVLERIAGGAPLGDVLDTIARGVEGQSADGMLCSILVVDPADPRRLRSASAPSLPNDYSRLIDRLEIAEASGSCGTAAHTRELVIVDDIATDPKWASFRDVALGFGLRACSSAPILRADGSVAGTIAVYYREAKRATPRDLELLRTAGHLAGIAIERDRAEATVRGALEAERAARAESDRARAESDRAGRMKDEFLATLSHELRTPLSAMLGWSQILRREGVKPTTLRQGLDTIERNARAQTQIIDDLLDMSRIISGKVVLEPKPLDLAEALQGAVDSVRPAAQNKGVDLSIEYAEAAQAVADANRIQQVFWNLLSNAVKFTPRGGRVSVALDRDASQWRVRVADSGEGIAADFLPFVFDRFRQADASTTRRHGGLGLGLAIVKQIVELHGGTVAVQSEGPGQGATFTVRLPMPAARGGRSVAAPATDVVPATPATTQPTTTTPAAPKEPMPAAAPVGGPAWDERDARQLAGRRVLVVDDEADARGLLRHLLESCGATVIEAADAEAGVAAVAASLTGEAFDVLVSDIGMPGENGYAMLTRIRALGGSAQRLPAIALTAYARAEDRVAALRAGFQLHVPKPVEPAELITTVATVTARPGV